MIQGRTEKTVGNTSLARIEELKKLYDFRWEVLDIIISGKSSIDSSQGFQIENLEDADRFVKSYGFDLKNPIEKAEAFGNFHESTNFIRKYFLQPENPEGVRLEIPRKILEITDIRELFLMSSLNPGPHEPHQILLKNWACSILKVMHTVAHIDQDLRASYFADIQKQIFDRFYRVIHRDGDGQLYLGERPDDPQRIDLKAFETKPKKSRDSTLLKLLHKPENVAEDIFDSIGLRFITKTPLDALRVVKYMKDQRLVMPPNIKPSRSRNTLVELERFRGRMADLFVLIEKSDMSEATWISELQAAAHPPAVNPDNPHTSEFYRAIQFTCRQLIKLGNPLYEDVKNLKRIAKRDDLTDEVKSLIGKIDLKYVQREIRFFYPYEIQLVDIKSHEENERGRSAHSEYKKAQLQTAMRRVLGVLMDVAH